MTMRIRVSGNPIYILHLADPITEYPLLTLTGRRDCVKVHAQNAAITRDITLSVLQEIMHLLHLTEPEVMLAICNRFTSPDGRLDGAPQPTRPATPLDDRLLYLLRDENFSGFLAAV